MLEPNPLDTFLTALTGRDFAVLATCLSPAARARLLLPRGPEEISGREPIARRLEGWFAPATEFEVLSTNSTEVSATTAAAPANLVVAGDFTNGAIDIWDNFSGLGASTPNPSRTISGGLTSV